MRLISNLIREPVVHFLFFGCLLYAAASLHARTTDPQRIVVSDAVVKRLTDRYVQQFGSMPPSDRLEYLIGRYIQDEALYRQGTAMGLGNDDEIIRRRIIQKMEFLGDGDSYGVEPTKQQLRAYFDEHSSRYIVPERVSFSHIYFSPDQGGDAKARDRAVEALARLNASKDSSFVPSGDSFPGRLNFALEDRDEVTRSFGESAFAQVLFSLSVGRWSGPIRSGYGWHLVQLQARKAPHTPNFATVVEDVRTDWRNDRQNQLKREALQRIVAQYQVIREDHARDRLEKK
ncbi:peptidyl-prolyl cis-trans isomerase [Denitratisoma oestradiolicum]|uniref:peptidylprolyl isomerase n=1 Tax=Denitratisoma oestradiolicum TaxID=311182 RepID=A0A6S6XZL5_9PROT|nr:peptidylprolyl isomerase [Denitratisoma oestradiolicum]TWO78878.1 hypothetical protein CBW56_17810 [Denitratisoma oestradiolicum]CAB1369881.1 conserved protein of unknown function [Denitratisoma oestradiolicum]